MDTQEDSILEKVKGKRTYIVAGLMVLHNIGKMAGFDLFDEQFISNATDLVLGALTIYYRFLAELNKRKEVVTALYTPVPREPISAK